MIFLSHNHKDKPVVEPVALRLREIFGEEAVFYDSWAIKPGDGIIEKMNDGLADPKFVFFFVSEASLQSQMVRLEWQTGLMKATSGQCKLVPIRVDGCEMPPLLLQSLYIDMHTKGIEAAIVQIVNVVQGNTTFTPEHTGFSNLTFHVTGDPAIDIIITIEASHLMEPNPCFLFILTNAEKEVRVEMANKTPFNSGYQAAVRLSNGLSGNSFYLRPMNATLTPKFPLRVRISRKGDDPIELLAVLHEVAEQNFEAIPQCSPTPGGGS